MRLKPTRKSQIFKEFETENGVDTVRTGQHSVDARHGIVKLTSAKRKIPNFMLTPHTLNGFWAMVRHESKLRFSKVRYTVAVVLCLPIWK